MAPDLHVPAGMVRHRFAAMGTAVSVLLPARDSRTGFRVVRQIFQDWETTFSRFLPESELCAVNAMSGRPAVVSPLFLSVLTTALAAARATDGIYDPTLLPQLAAAGYDRPFIQLDKALPPASAAPLAGGRWRAIRVDEAAHTVLLPPDAALDFGGIAKEMAVDAALAQLIALGVAPAAVEAGGDLAVHGRLPEGDAWPVAVETPDGSEVVDLRAGALATSSVGRRRWRQGDVMRHHLLDPRTGEPATSDLWSVTVAATGCAQAGVAAKTALILGAAHGAAFLAAHQLPGLLIDHHGVRHRVGRWLPSLTGVTA